ncbi:hypothetical protein KVR01_013542 [Diaporthe batatas]|uniref:uncharacterized protein n=1 Tax=Diaporthe batatas TaxID=748121 RepID=UPI001D0498CC|nr:uncharacterized protein KVR01_013542 [Diaporthe batatas]KAG8156591.1 hypothetical protein KVR01_013542 [Diaporthe batatas]
MSNKPAIIIISGAFGTPKSYGKLATALESDGYEVHVPQIPTNSEIRPPTAGLAEDTAFIRSYVKGLVTAGRNVVAIGHSWGGQLMSNALCGLGLKARSAQGLEGGVSALVYMAAFALPKGTSTFGKLCEFGASADDAHLLFDMAEDGTIVLRDSKHEPFLGLREPGIEESEIEAYIQTCSRWNGRAMTEPLKNEAWREIPVAYIHTTKDAAVPYAVQQSMVEAVEKAGHHVRTFTLESAHSPYFTATSGVVDAINKIILSDGPA